MRVRRGLGKESGGARDGDVVGNSGAGTGSVGALEGVLIDVAGCFGLGGEGEEGEEKSGEECAMHSCFKGESRVAVQVMIFFVRDVKSFFLSFSKLLVL